MTKAASSPTVLKTISGPESCEMCGKTGLKTEIVRDPFIYGAGSDAEELSADIPVYTCSHCSVSFTGEEAEVARHEAVCRHLGVLTPGEIRALRRRYKVSRAAFARVTGFGEATLARWERREVIQNSSSDNYLRLLMNQDNFQQLSIMSARAEPSGAEKSAVVGQAISVMALEPDDEERYRAQASKFKFRKAA